MNEKTTATSDSEKNGNEPVDQHRGSLTLFPYIKTREDINRIRNEIVIRIRATLALRRP